MAWYVDGIVVVKGDAALSHWSLVHKPGDKVPLSGIYRCTVCKKEVTSNKDDPFPTQNHHQHAPQLGDIGWKMIVRTNTEGS